MPESERMYTILDRIEDKLDHVTERLVRVETKQHAPDDCPGAKRIETTLKDHIQEHEQMKRDAGWKAFIKDTVKMVLAGGAGGAAGWLSK